MAPRRSRRCGPTRTRSCPPRETVLSTPASASQSSPAAAAAVRRRWATNVLDAPAPQTTRILIDVTFLRTVWETGPGWHQHVLFRPCGTLLAAPLSPEAVIMESSRTVPSARELGGIMSRQRQDQLLAALLREEGWATAGTLADLLGVTPRSIRSYVAALNARTPGAAVVESGPAGYRAGPGARGALRVRQGGDSAPRERLHALVRLLLDAEEGIDVFDTADALHVSEATLEADLVRVRGLLDGTDLTLERARERVRLRGDEAAQRRLLSRLAHDEMDDASFHPEIFRRALSGTAVDARAVGPFKSALVGELGELGYYVNELAIADVLLHIAIAAGRALDAPPVGARPEIPRVGAVIARLAAEHFTVVLGEGDSGHLASLVLTRIVAPGGEAAQELARSGVAPDVETAVRAEIARAAEDYRVDLVDETFVLRLALH
ncbi:unnamed protein product, partial [Penicillium discolor]